MEPSGRHTPKQKKSFPFSAAECAKTGNRVAIKKFNRPFQSIIHARRTFRELRLLRCMEHENVIDLIDVFTPDTSSDTLADVFVLPGV